MVPQQLAIMSGRGCGRAREPSEPIDLMRVVGGFGFCFDG